MNKIIVTGCAGYIGSVLCKYLQDCGYYIVGIDNLFFQQNIINHQINMLYTDDVSKNINIKHLCRVHADATAFINLAAIVGMPLCDKYPRETLLTNIETTRLLVKYLPPHVKILQPCTNSQYGTNDDICTEETPTNPISLYSVSKCISEDILLTRENTVSLRLATVFGLSERMRDELLVNYYVKELTQKKKLTIYQPKFRRNYIHINDICRGFLHAINKNLSGVYNLGDDNLNTDKITLANTIAEIIGGKVETIDGGLDPDQRDYIVSSQKFYDTGFQPLCNFEHSVKELSNYYSTC